jgi:hypothetical protein
MVRTQELENITRFSNNTQLYLRLEWEQSLQIPTTRRSTSDAVFMWFLVCSILTTPCGTRTRFIYRVPHSGTVPHERRGHCLRNVESPLDSYSGLMLRKRPEGSTPLIPQSATGYNPSAAVLTISLTPILRLHFHLFLPPPSGCFPRLLLSRYDNGVLRPRKINFTKNEFRLTMPSEVSYTLELCMSNLHASLSSL